MKKFTLLTLICLTSFGLFAQEKEFSVSVARSDDSGKSDSIVMIPDTINFVTKHLLHNGQPISSSDTSSFSNNTNLYNVLWSYDEDQRAADGNDDYMFIDAFSKADVIWIPRSVPWETIPGGAQYFIEGNVEIPLIRKLIFEPGARIDVQGELKGNYSVIQADPWQIFSETSNLSKGFLDWAKNMDVYPEWFGGLPDSTTDCRAAIQQCLDIFGQNVYLNGWAYRVKGTLLLDEANSIFMNSKTFLLPDPGTNGPTDKDPPLFKITREPFVIEGGVIWVERGYNGWIWDVQVERTGSADYLPRYSSRISNIIVKGEGYGEVDYSGLAYSGIKVQSQRYSDYSYFSVVQNVDFRYSDTAIFLSGHPESGMSNSWHWANVTVDWTMYGIILDSKASGHVFSNLVMQPNKKDHSLHLIDVAGQYNSFHGMIWDVEEFSEAIVLRENASHNWFSSMGYGFIYSKNTKDYNPKMWNTFTTAGPFDPTNPMYRYYTMEGLSIGFEDNETKAPQLAVAQQDYTPVTNVIAKTTNIARGGLDRIAATYPALAITTQSLNDVMDKGFGGGIHFLNKDPNNVYNEYSTNIMARILARSEETDSETKGLLQFWTKGSYPAMTIRNSGRVGINTFNPGELFEIWFPNDTDGKPDANRDIELGQGATDRDVTFITLRSPNGTKYYVTVGDDGSFTSSTSKP